MTTHHPTFEVAPIEQVEGQQVQLVYTRVSDHASQSDYRLHALRLAIDTQAMSFRGKDSEDPAGGVITDAARYLDFINGGAA